ncbi:hypothetical protein D1872_333900 [compost metagenome]
MSILQHLLFLALEVEWFKHKPYDALGRDEENDRADDDLDQLRRNPRRKAHACGAVSKHTIK